MDSRHEMGETRGGVVGYRRWFRHGMRLSSKRLVGASEWFSTMELKFLYTS